MTHLSSNLQKTKDSHPIEICQSKVILISFSKGRLKTQITENHDIIFFIKNYSRNISLHYGWLLTKTTRSKNKNASLIHLCKFTNYNRPGS